MIVDMAIPEIEFNLHDAVIINACFNEKGRLEADIELYEIFYPEKPVVKLVISGIYNLQKVELLVQDMKADPCEEDWLGYRINAFHYDEKKQSTQENMYLYFDVEHNKPVKIHCKKVNFIVQGKIT